MRKLSIIIVNWNTADLTRQAIMSVFKETSAFEYEVIVVDNNSSDKSVEMIRSEFPSVKLIENKNNFGFAKANNQALAVAEGEYLMLLNSDTIVKNKAINILSAYLDQHPEVAMVGPKLLNGDMTFQHACRRNLPDIWNSFFHLFNLTKIFKKSLVVNNYKRYNDNPDVEERITALSGAAVMFRRSVYEKIGGLDEGFFFYGEDLDFCKRVFDQGMITMFVPSAQIIHFGGGSSKKRRTKSLFYFYNAMWIYYKKHFAQRYPFIVNWLVWFGIQFRFVVALLFNLAKKK